MPSVRIGLLFLGSGFAALIYEIVWFHLLRLVIGGTSISLGIVLASFLGGLGLGSILLPQWLEKRGHPLRIYALLELLIGLYVAAIPWFLPWVSRTYAQFSAATGQDLIGRGLLAAAILLPATMLMGATLPVIGNWERATREGLARMGGYYGLNTLGAVAGSATAGFLLLPFTDTLYASNVAALVNLILALSAWAMSRRVPLSDAKSCPAVPSDLPKQNISWRLAAILALSGFTSLSAEVVWTRLLSMLYGATTYTFANILMVFLLGLGVGSSAGAWLATRCRRPLQFVAWGQYALLPTLVIANLLIGRILPHWHTHVEGPFYDYGVFWHNTFRTIVAVFPAAVLWGGSFTLALSSAERAAPSAGRLVGQAYAANTFGAILGSLVSSLYLIPNIGSQHTQQVILLLLAVSSFLAFSADRNLAPRHSESMRKDSLEEENTTWVARHRYGILFTGGVVACCLALIPLPNGFLGNSIMPQHWAGYKHLYEREGANTAVVVFEEEGYTYRSLCVAGKVEASTLTDDLRCQRMLGHMPALIHPDPRTTLSIGLGAGTTAGCFTLYPSVDVIDVCEIEPAVIPAARDYFADVNQHVVVDPRTNIIIDDARHYIAQTKKKYDIITSDSIHPWVRGSAVLYSQEYLELCKAHLNPGGVAVLWVPLYQSDFETVACEIKTFLSVFPSITLWSSGRVREHGYDLIAVAQLEEEPLDLQYLERRIRTNPELQRSLDEVNLGSVIDLFQHYVGRGREVAPLLADIPVNREVSLKLEYIAGMSANMQDGSKILGILSSPLVYPADWLKNDEDYSTDIKRVIGLVEK